MADPRDQELTPTPTAAGEGDWRGRIRPLAIVVFRRPDGAILAAPGFDPVKQQRFYRPLGGEIEFWERAEDAARREIREEAGAEITDVRLLAVTENIFTFLGARGHELVWTFEASFADPSFYEGDVVQCREGDATFEAHWVPLKLFERGEAPLYPDGLLAALVGHGVGYAVGMGLTFIDMEVANVGDPERKEPIQFLVDSGATYSVVPASVLDRLGILPHTEQAFRLANGDRIIRKRGTALFKYGDRIGGADVIFGEAGDSRLLGALTLEAMGLALDPIRRELLDLPMMLAEDTVTER